MKISYSWIKDFLDINLTIDEVAETLTMLGLEAEISTNFDEVEKQERLICLLPLLQI